MNVTLAMHNEYDETWYTFLGYYWMSTFQPCSHPRQHDIQPYGRHFANVVSRWSRPRQG
jgi:hypothetical protein